MRTRNLAAALLVAAASAGVAIAAEKDATGILAVRQHSMDANGSHMQAIKFILTDQKQLLPLVEYHAQAIKETAEHVPDLFPPGSDQGPTSALPKVWEDRQGFQAAAQRAQELADKLVTAAKSGNAEAAAQAFGALGKQGCGGCHETYRKKQS